MLVEPSHNSTIEATKRKINKFQHSQNINFFEGVKLKQKCFERKITFLRYYVLGFMEKWKLIKHLGQNFLISKKIAQEIVDCANLVSNDCILEVGPGQGILTEILLKEIFKGKLIAIEKDKRFVKLLKQKFSSYKNLIFIQGDILKLNPLKIGLHPLNYKIVANIPYYLTSRFLRKFLESEFQPSKMILMIQKEVAKKIVAKNGQESILSLSVKSYSEPKIIRIVKAKYFLPQPRVDSAILLIDKISKNFFKEILKKKLEKKNKNCKENLNEIEKRFFYFLKQGFLNKRKLLKNNLKINPEIFKRCQISEKSRAENLSLKDWKCLFFEI